ncbi:uncharacterized protein LOC119274761 [Triticum dicoccoides]|uniref:uncharacterized protein LOC119274761 n=1 Tax=Triticum dicoccoides TaxID=85692 RepID=UPI00188E0D10|nr:uncharacterized protein LOC119274761 [Triticum dicoccoides]
MPRLDRAHHASSLLPHRGAFSSGNRPRRLKHGTIRRAQSAAAPNDHHRLFKFPYHGEAWAAQSCNSLTAGRWLTPTISCGRPPAFELQQPACSNRGLAFSFVGVVVLPNLLTLTDHQMSFNALSELRPGNSLRRVRVHVSCLWHHHDGTENCPIKHMDLVILDSQNHRIQVIFEYTTASEVRAIML